MRKLLSCMTCMTCMTWMATAHAHDGFDACAVFTAEAAEQVMEATVTAEPNGKRRQKPVMTCSYRGVKEGRPVEAAAQFRFASSDAEAQRAFVEARLNEQTKPFLISGYEAFWSSRTGELNLRKGRAWVTLWVGPDTVREREAEHAVKLAELLAKKL